MKWMWKHFRRFNNTERDVVQRNSCCAPFPDQTLTSSLIRDLWIGALILLTSVACLLAYCLLLYLFLRQAYFRRNSCYQLIISLSTCDAIGLICWLFMAAYILRHGENFMPSELYTTVVFALFINWRLTGYYQAILAVNRYVAVCHSFRYDRYFSTGRVQLMIIVSICLSIVYGLPALFDGHISFSLSFYNIDYGYDVEFFYEVEDPLVSLLLVLVSVVCYLGILNRHRKSRAIVGTIDDSSTRKQWRLALQTLPVSFLYTFSGLSSYFLLFLADTDVWAYFLVATYSWILCSCSSAVVSFTFNDAVRRELRKRRKTCFLNSRLNDVSCCKATAGVT